MGEKTRPNSLAMSSWVQWARPRERMRLFQRRISRRRADEALDLEANDSGSREHQCSALLPTKPIPHPRLAQSQRTDCCLDPNVEIWSSLVELMMLPPSAALSDDSLLWTEKMMNFWYRHRTPKDPRKTDRIFIHPRNLLQMTHVAVAAKIISASLATLWGTNTYKYIRVFLAKPVLAILSVESLCPVVVNKEEGWGNACKETRGLWLCCMCKLGTTNVCSIQPHDNLCKDYRWLCHMKYL